MDFSLFFVIFILLKFKPVKSSHVGYYFLTLLLFGGSLFMSGQSISNSTVTIIGGDPGVENSGADPNASLAAPPDGGQFADPQNIEPTLENSFHIRYRIDTRSKEEEKQVSDEYASISTGTISSRMGSSGGTKIKRKRAASLAEFSFNLKKRYKAWMPKRKKKYRPNVCGRF